MKKARGHLRNGPGPWMLTCGVAVMVAVASGAMADPGGVPVFTHGVASGDVTASSAILWTRIDRDTTVKVEVWDNPELKGMKAFQQTVPHASAAHDFTVKVDATGLSPDTLYYYRFKHDDTDGTSSSDIGTFRTAPSPSVAADLRFTYTGDADGTRNASGVPAYNEFETLRAARLEGGAFFVFDGDTIYSDSRFRSGGPATTLAEYQATHRENRGHANLRALLASTSVYAAMDDHEIVDNYDVQTGDLARYAAGRQAFLDYYPIRETGLLHDSSCAGDPLYRTFRWGRDVEVFLLDERSCREGYAAERTELLTFLGQQGIQGVQFLSTDIHATMLNQVAIDRFAAPAPVAVELVTGPIAAVTYQSQVLAFGGTPALQAVYALLALDGVDCRNLNRNSYGLVEVSAGAGILNLASKDANGAIVVDPTTLGQCALSQGPP